MNLSVKYLKLLSVIAGVILIAWATLALATDALASEPGQAAADQVSVDSYRDFLDLWLHTHVGDNRGFGPEHDLARDNIASLLESYGMTVTLEPFTYSSDTYYNVVGEKLGTTNPDQIYIVGAHYDSVNNPGADDDASGVALFLEVARIVSQYDSDHTIRFIGFDREEQGLIGSSAYVDAHINENIVGMVQADMVAYDPGTYHALIYGSTESDPIKTALGDAINEYSGQLTYTIGGTVDQSDHAPFEWAGFQACLLIEGEVWNNPYYHTQQDNFENPDNLNFVYGAMMTRSVVGFLVDHAGVQVPVDVLEYTYPDGRPEYVDPAGGTRMRVEVSGLGDAIPQPGTGMLHYDIGNGWQSLTMETITDNVYDAVFPPGNCSQVISYYVSAEAVGGEPFTDPRNAPQVSYWAILATGQTIHLQDDFEADLGWIVEDIDLQAGAWERGVPSGSGGGRGDPLTDFDGSGSCFVTGNGFDEDLDGGPTRLLSPTYDLSGVVEPQISYARWFYNNDADQDRLDVEISDDNGSSWVLVESTVHTNGWQEATIAVTDHVAATSQVRLRFSATDNPNDSITEAAIDAVKIFSFDCGSNVVIPDSVTVTRGYYVSGDAASLSESDNVDLALQRLVTDVQSRTEFEVIGTSPTISPTSFDVTLEGAVFARSTVVQTIELNDYVAGAWELVDTRNATNMVDSIATVVPTGDLSRFVDQTTLEVKARVHFQSLSARQRFASNTDQFMWTIGQ